MNVLSLAHDRAPRLAAVLAFTALAMLVPVSVAQTPVSDTGDGPHPAHIHSGTCAALGDVVIPLADVAFPAGDQVGAASAFPLKISTNFVVEMPLQEIIDGEYAINIHQSAEEIDVYIACGDIGGVLTKEGEDGPDELRFALGELNESGHTGVVFLSAQGDQTEVNIMLIEPGEFS